MRRALLPLLILASLIGATISWRTPSPSASAIAESAPTHVMAFFR